MGHVEQEGISPQAFTLQQVTVFVVLVQHFHIDRFERRTAFHQQAAHFAQAAGGLQVIECVAVTRQHTAIANGDALTSEQQFCRTPNPGIVHAAQHIAHNGLHHQVDEQGRQLVVTALDPTHVGRFE